MFVPKKVVTTRAVVHGFRSMLQTTPLGRLGVAAAGVAASALLVSTARAEAPLAERTETPDRLKGWKARWETGNTRWHLEHVHPLLKKFLPELLGPEERTPLAVLFPLCGASVDLAFLARRGHVVVGVDGAPGALTQLLADWGEEISPAAESGAAGTPDSVRVRVGQAGAWQQELADREGAAENTRFTTSPLLLAVEADFLALDGPVARQYGLGAVDAAFDRGSIVAIDPADRPKYAQIMSGLMAPGGRLLLVAVEHEPAFGPPHSVDEAEVRKLFGANFDVRVLSREPRIDAEPAWRGRGATRFDEVAYLCTRRSEH